MVCYELYLGYEYLDRLIESCVLFRGIFVLFVCILIIEVGIC